MKLSTNSLLIKFWPIVFIFTIWLIFASPYFIKGLIPFSSRYLVTFFPPWSAAYAMPVKNNAMPDVMTQIYPWKKITIDTWKNGAVPLWNPYSFSGTPHAANYQTAVFSPFNLLFFVLPFVDAWSLLVLLQPLLAGLFMYFFLQTLERSKAASLIGSLSFMFCGFLVVWMAYGTLGWAVLWLPLTCVAVARHFKKRSWWNFVVLSLALALSFVSGHFQMSTYVLFAVAAFIFFGIIINKNIRAGSELIVAAVAGLLLSAPQILPSLEAYKYSVRSQLFTQAGGIAWQYLVTLFAPDFFGNPVTRNDWFGYYAEWASYVGVVPLLLGLFTLISKKIRETWFFLGLTAVSILVATPTPFNALIIQLKIPAISTSYAARVILLVSFSLSVLSGYGFDAIMSAWKKEQRKIVIFYASIIGIFLLFLWSLIFVFHPFPADKLLIAKRNLILPTGLSVATVALFLFGFIKKRNLNALVQIVLIGLTAFDMLHYSAKWMPFDPKEFVFPPMAVENFLRQKVGYDRVFGNIYNEFTGYNFLQSIIGYDAVYQGRYGEFISTAKDGKIGKPERSVVNLEKYGLYSEKILELLGVRYLVHRLSDGRLGWAYPYWEYPFYKSIYKDQYYEVLESSQALPRAFLVSSYAIEANDQAIINRLFDKNFNIRDSVVLESKPIIDPQPGEGTVKIETYAPERIRLKVETKVPKILFLSDVFDRGWQAKVNGKLTPVYRADYDFRAIAVPTGTHQVEFTYNPISFRIGVLAALGVILFLLSGSLRYMFL